MPIQLNPGVVLSVGDEDYIGVDCSRYLDAGETVSSGTLTAVSGLTLGAVVPLAAALIMQGESVAVGHGITFSIKGQVLTGSPYTVPVSITTSAGRVKKFGCVFTVQ